MIKKLIALTLTIIILELLSGRVLAEESPYPDPPSEEQKAEWRRLGAENVRKYGSTAIQPTKQFIPTPTPTLKPTASVAAVVNEDKVSEINQIDSQKTPWFLLWAWIKNLFL